MKNDRKFDRVKKYFAVNIVACDVNGQHMDFGGIKTNPKFYDETGVDFCPEGAKVMCSKSLPAEAKIQMKMMIPDEDNLNIIRANGEIKWFKQVKGKYKKFFFMGVHFRDLSEEDRGKLMSLWKKYK